MFESNLKKGFEFFAKGNSLILIDDTKPITDAAIICLAKYTTAATVNCMVTNACGMLSISMPAQIAEKAGLYSQTRYENRSESTRNYTFSIDAVESTTGISAFERSFSIQKFAKTLSVSGFISPGHVFPVVAKSTNLFDKQTVIEGALTVAREATEEDSLVTVCDILNDKGEMANALYAAELGKKLNIPVIFLSDLLLLEIQKENFTVRKNITEFFLHNNSVLLYNYEIADKTCEVIINKSNINNSILEMKKMRYFLNENSQYSSKSIVYTESFSQAIKSLTVGIDIVIIFKVDTKYLFPYSMIVKMIFEDLEKEIEGNLQEIS